MLPDGSNPGFNATSATIGYNNISDNGGLGVDLVAPGGIAADGVTPNDPLDGDEGGNHQQNHATISEATYTDGILHVEGDLHSRRSSSYIITFFAVEECVSGSGDDYTPIGTGGGSSTGEDGHGIFALGFGVDNPPPAVSALATDMDTRDTSEFSPCVPVVGD